VSRYHSYINSTKDILSIYKGDEPLSSFLKKYFSANKKFGSKDRKQISNLCYCFFRMGKAIMNTSIEEKILTGLFLCSDKSNEILAASNLTGTKSVTFLLAEKLLIINSSLLIPEIFPWKNELSEEIDHENFCNHFLIQPDLFLRLRPGKKK
jgi:16S rRNA (cytosine967-C5)-methyltransferase